MCSVHFRDVRIWSDAVLFSEHKAKLESIITAVRTHGLLDHSDLQALLSSHSRASLLGFPKDVDVPDIVALHELLGENWIGKRILDARAYQIMTMVNSQAGNSRALLNLPAIFYLQLSNAYRSNRLSKSLKDLWESLLANLPDIIGFATNKQEVHWAPCATMTKDRLVCQGDPLGWAPDTKLLVKLKWFLGDVMEVQGDWQEEPLAVPRQGPGSGSCGLITLSAIHSLADPTVPLWSTDKAAEFRLAWLKDLLEQHITTMRGVSAC